MQSFKEEMVNNKIKEFLKLQKKYDLKLVTNSTGEEAIQYRVFLVIEPQDKSTTFYSLEDAKNYVFNKLVEKGYNPQTDIHGVFNELNKTYKDETYEGFRVGNLFQCDKVVRYR